jgi:hypothetical protein
MAAGSIRRSDVDTSLVSTVFVAVIRAVATVATPRGTMKMRKQKSPAGDKRPGGKQ